jgi:putative tryptophan/tyrosine transport system substrate-binding protein
MRRREFVTLLGGAAAAWPLAAHAQQPALPVIGFLHTRSPDDTANQVAAFRRGLAEQGYVEGQSVTIEYRFARGRYDQLPDLATDLVRRQVAVLVAVGGDPAALAAKRATSTIPIVFAVGSDPVKLGLVGNYTRPTGNATGMNILTSTLESKRLGLLHELVPQAATIGFLTNPRFASAVEEVHDVQEAARALALELRVLPAVTEKEIDAAFKTISDEKILALAVGSDPFFDTQRDKIIALAARYSTPAIYQFREHAAAGGLMSYGIDIADAYRQIGVQVGRILKGKKTADLPILQPTKFEFVVNLKTARALGVKFSPDLISLTDEVIE